MRYGKLKPQVIREMDLPSQDNISLTSTETPPPLYVPSSQHGMQKVKNNLSSLGVNKVSNSNVNNRDVVFCSRSWTLWHEDEPFVWWRR